MRCFDGLATGIDGVAYSYKESELPIEHGVFVTLDRELFDQIIPLTKEHA